MNLTARRAAAAPLALSVLLAVAACASGDDASDADSTSMTGSVASASSDDPPSASDDSAAPAEDGSTASAGGAEGGPGGSATARTAAGLAAVPTAEQAAGGVAYEIDDQDDDGTWQVDVRTGDTTVEVTVSADGTTALDQKNDDLDDDDKAGLDAATITLGEAIQKAVDEVGGALDDAELDEENGQHYWKVSVDTNQQDDVEVQVSVTGEILKAHA